MNFYHQFDSCYRKTLKKIASFHVILKQNQHESAFKKSQDFHSYLCKFINYSG